MLLAALGVGRGRDCYNIIGEDARLIRLMKGVSGTMNKKITISAGTSGEALNSGAYLTQTSINESELSRLRKRAEAAESALSEARERTIQECAGIIAEKLAKCSEGFEDGWSALESVSEELRALLTSSPSEGTEKEG